MSKRISISAHAEEPVGLSRSIPRYTAPCGVTRDERRYNPFMVSDCKAIVLNHPDPSIRVSRYSGWVRKFPAEFLSALILGLRPILGPATCKFELTCTKYAVLQLKELPLHKATWAIIRRLFACSPFKN